MNAVNSSTSRAAIDTLSARREQSALSPSSTQCPNRAAENAAAHSGDSAAAKRRHPRFPRCAIMPGDARDEMWMTDNPRYSGDLLLQQSFL
jgi:hypothetical protein